MRLYVLGGIGGSRDKLLDGLVQLLREDGLHDIRIFRPFGGGSKGVNTLLAIQSAILPRKDQSSRVLALRVLHELQGETDPLRSRLGFIAISAGATVAFNCAMLLQSEGIRLVTVLTVGGVVLRHKPKNIDRWVQVIGTRDWALLCNLLNADATRMIPGATHNGYLSGSRELLTRIVRREFL